MMSRIIARIAPNFAFSNGLNTNDLSRFEETRRLHDEDPLVHDRISAGLFDMIERSGKFALEKAGDLKYPALLIHGGMDKITSWEATSNFAEKASEAEFHLFEKCYHEILNEPEWREALNNIADWIEDKITRPMPERPSTAREKRLATPLQF